MPTRDPGEGPVDDRRMLSFDVASHRFDLRAAIVIIEGQHVLLHRAAGDLFWSLPGGRVEAGEAAADAASREMREETGESVRCGRLMFVVENFFGPAGERHHEVGLYFEAFLRGDSPLRAKRPFEGREGSRLLSFDWFARSGLADVDVRPAPLRQVLAAPPAAPLHLVHRESA